MWLVRCIKGIFQRNVNESKDCERIREKLPSFEEFQQKIFAKNQQAAINGDVGAQFDLARQYELMDKDYFRAMGWYTKAAEQGYAEAQYCLGLMHKNGCGVPQDHSKAAYWFRKAAEQEHSSSKFWLYVMYRDGLGVSQNDDMANYWADKFGDPRPSIH